ncbi:hypothetical protein BY996DRAFT_6473098 [Phakopsora pachyrhizi]|nr:hypothetical protein BY996DRAFT_6473098 [Phakopsora pachyrhizi]
MRQFVFLVDFQLANQQPRCGGRFGKKGMRERRAPREVKGGFCWILLGFEDKGVAGEGNGWRHWKEEKKLGGGAHQGLPLKEYPA